MDMRKTGLVLGILGLFLLLIASIIGTIIGNNEQTEMEALNDPDIGYSNMPTRVKEAEESSAFLYSFNKGLSSFGIGLILIGIGFSLAKDAINNRSVILVGIIALIILFSSFIISAYEGMMSRERAEIRNKDDPTEKDRDRIDEIDEKQAFLSPFNEFIGGFFFGSLGIALALFTIVVSLSMRKKSKKELEKEEANYFSIEPLIEEEIEEIEEEDIEEVLNYAEIIED